MHLVVLAAGLGTRFGGLKQLAPVGPHGEAIMDVLLDRAAASGFDRASVVIRDEIEAPMTAHLTTFAPRLPHAVVVQAMHVDRDRPLGTAHAVLACRPHIDGPFAVVNADDLYPDEAFTALTQHCSTSLEHALVAFRFGRTVVGDRPVSRALLTFDEHGDHLAGIEENTALAPSAVPEDAWVSMNMWGFQQPIFDVLETAVDAFVESATPGEVRLPDVVASMVAGGEKVRVLRCEGSCIGITYAEDVDAVRRFLA